MKTWTYHAVHLGRSQAIPIDHFNELGLQGWELTQIISHDESFDAIFKRCFEIPDSSYTSPGIPYPMPSTPFFPGPTYTTTVVPQTMTMPWQPQTISGIGGTSSAHAEDLKGFNRESDK